MNTSPLKGRPAHATTATGPTWQTRALAIVAALIVNAVILFAGRLLMSEFPVATVGSDEQTIGIAQVAIVTTLSGLLAWGLLAVLERTTARPAMIWMVTGFIVLAVSMLGPIDGAVDTESAIVLALMHLGAAATIIPMMRSTVADEA